MKYNKNEIQKVKETKLMELEKHPKIKEEASLKDCDLKKIAKGRY